VTGKERILEVLSDGLPHSHRELYRLGVMAHSRVADLRKDGHNISCWWEDHQYFYRLEQRLLESATVDGLSPVADSSGRPAGASASPLGGGAAAAAQLVLPVGTKGAYS
jgi:hypothetical protein